MATYNGRELGPTPTTVRDIHSRAHTWDGEACTVTKKGRWLTIIVNHRVVHSAHQKHTQPRGWPKALKDHGPNAWGRRHYDALIADEAFACGRGTLRIVGGAV